MFQTNGIESALAENMASNVLGKGIRRISMFLKVCVAVSKCNFCIACISATVLHHCVYIPSSRDVFLKRWCIRGTDEYDGFVGFFDSP